MEKLTDAKIVLIVQKTRLENLIYRYNTIDQAKFYIEHHNGDFTDYKLEHDNYTACVKKATAYLETYGRLTVVERRHISNYLFGKDDLIVAIGRDGLIANIMKYLDGQLLIGVNPDPARWDGVLLPFSADDLNKIIPEARMGLRQIKQVTIASAKLNDGQEILGVNDLFIGQRTHTSARYKLSFHNMSETQSSSGIIVSTGLGSTGWLKSILAGAVGIDAACGVTQRPSIESDFCWSSKYLYFTVREPYPSTSTGADIVFGKITNLDKMEIVSNMPENGVIFSDGVEQDFLQFNSGMIATIGLADKVGMLVV